jgi:hypothetical protein
MKEIDLKDFSAEDIASLLRQKREEERQAALRKRAAYEELRSDLIGRFRERVTGVRGNVWEFWDFTVKETSAFYEIMKEYGQLRSDEQMNYKIKDDGFCIEVKTSRVKKFDERADVAAERLIGFLRGWIRTSDRGEEDVMYQMAMTLLERNRYGDLDYKSISKLYDYEDRFGSEEYSEIMRLFRESNVEEGTVTNFYFYERTELGVWRRIEVSFNRM